MHPLHGKERTVKNRRLLEKVARLNTAANTDSIQEKLRLLDPEISELAESIAKLLITMRGQHNDLNLAAMCSDLFLADAFDTDTGLFTQPAFWNKITSKVMTEVMEPEQFIEKEPEDYNIHEMQVLAQNVMSILENNTTNSVR